MLNLKKGRKEAKNLFMVWVNGDERLPQFDILFPVVSRFIKSVKSKEI